MDERYETVSLCSGAMGLDIGVARTNRFRLLAAIERDSDCCATVRANRDAGRIEPGLSLYEADLERLAPGRVMADLGLRGGELPLLLGAPPCQSYSYAGHQQGVADPRGLTLWQAVWYVEALQPKVFVFENVMGLLSARLSPAGPKGSVLRRFVDDLPPEYRVDVVVADAADFGVPQLRHRVFAIGNRHGLTAEFPSPTHGPPGCGLPPWRTLRDALDGLAEDEPLGLGYRERDGKVYDLVPPGGNWRSLPPDIARDAMGAAYSSNTGGRTGWYRRLAWDEPAPTLMVRPNRSRDARCHPDETRPLTVAEYARVQCFPDDWTFAGTVAAKYQQIGNAVPVPLGEAAGLAVANLLDEIRGGAVGDSEVPRFRFIDLRTCKRGRRHRVAS